MNNQEILLALQTPKPREDKDKTTFWASEAETCRRAIAFQFLKTPITNPIGPESRLIMEVGKKIEEELVERLKRAGLLMEVDEDQERIDIEREGIKISGKLDGRFLEGSPVEAKSFYGPYYEKELKVGQVKTNYLKQLAIYMDALNEKKGFMIHVDRGFGALYRGWLYNRGERKFEFVPLLDDPEQAFKTTVFDLDDTYKRWARGYDLMKKGELPPPDFQYKYPINQIPELIKSGEIAKYKVAKARNGHMVLGDFQCKYCQHKDHCLKMQGVELGYSPQEIEQLKKVDPTLKANQK